MGLGYVFIFKCTNTDNPNWIKKFWDWARPKVINKIKYTFYLRIILEAHESLLISSTFEINLLQVQNFADGLSFLFAVFILVFSLGLPLLSVYYLIKFYEKYDPNEKYL